MARFLITGARAPAAWDIAVNLERHGHQVYLADSLSNAIGRQCPAIQSFHVIPSAKRNLKKYQRSLCLLLTHHNIDYLLPTCEEIFYISSIRNDLSAHSEVICPDIKILQRLHNKRTVLDSIVGLNIEAPQTILLKDVEKPHQLDLSKYVLKKEYCRFGNDIHLNPSLINLNKARRNESNHNRCLLQEKIIGKEICCYAILTRGRVALCACYLPKYRLGKSASIYFESLHDRKILEFLRLFAKKYDYSGQISFDFIKNSTGLFLIECNPRATSGVHLCSNADLATLLTKTPSVTWSPSISETAQIKLAMILFGIPHHVFSRQGFSFLKDFRRGRDVLGGCGRYRILKQQFLSLYELVCLAIKNKQCLRAASTSDIEWDGKPLVPFYEH